MSFAFSVGDFLTVGQLSWKVYGKCKDSPGNYKELSTEVGALHNVIKETEELLSQQTLTPQQGTRLLACQQGCEDTLKDLDEVLVKYESLGTKSGRTFDRLGFGMQDINEIRLRLISNVSMLDAFNNASSHARVENKLNQLIAEVRAGKREGSVISNQTFDTTAQDKKQMWEALRRELEDIGISPGTITELRQFIISWFQKAAAAGKLEEDTSTTASADDDSTVFLNKTDRWPGTSDELSVPDRGIPSMTVKPNATGRPRIIERIGRNALRLLRQPSDSSRSQPPQDGQMPRSLSSYSLNELHGRDKQFLEAAIAGDLSTVKICLTKESMFRCEDLRAMRRARPCIWRPLISIKRWCDFFCPRELVFVR